MPDLLFYQQDGPVVTLTMNQPEQRKPLTGNTAVAEFAREAIHSRLDTVLELSAVFQAISHKTADHSEAVNAFLEKRAPVFR